MTALRVIKSNNGETFLGWRWRPILLGNRYEIKS
jgi:hypothetical protein